MVRNHGLHPLRTMVLKSPFAITAMFFSIARCQGGDFQDRGSDGGADHGSRPWFCEGGDHAGTGDHASFEINHLKRFSGQFPNLEVALCERTCFCLLSAFYTTPPPLLRTLLRTPVCIKNPYKAPSKNPSKKHLLLENLLRTLLRSVRLHDPLGVRPRNFRKITGGRGIHGISLRE